MDSLGSWHEGLSVRSQVEALLRDMMEVALRSGNEVVERETTEIATIALQGSMPVVDADMPAAMVRCQARAVLSRAWMIYLSRHLETNGTLA